MRTCLGLFHVQSIERVSYYIFDIDGSYKEKGCHHERKRHDLLDFHILTLNARILIMYRSLFSYPSLQVFFETFPSFAPQVDTCDQEKNLSTTPEEKRSLGRSRLPSLHEFQAPWEISLQTELGPQERTRLVQPLDVPSDLPRRVLPARGRKSQAHNVQHAVVKSVVEFCPAARVGVVVPTFVAAVGVQVAAKLDDEFEGERRAARQSG